MPVGAWWYKNALCVLGMASSFLELHTRHTEGGGEEGAGMVNQGLIQKTKIFCHEHLAFSRFWTWTWLGSPVVHSIRTVTYTILSKLKFCKSKVALHLALQKFCYHILAEIKLKVIVYSMLL